MTRPAKPRTDASVKVNGHDPKHLAETIAFLEAEHQRLSDKRAEIVKELAEAEEQADRLRTFVAVAREYQNGDTSDEIKRSYFKDAQAKLARLEVNIKQVREQPDQDDSQLAELEVRAERLRIFTEVAREYGEDLDGDGGGEGV